MIARPLALAALGGVMVQLAACGSVYGEELPTSDAADEASSDAGLADRSSSTDAEAAVPFCRTHATARFCADFDDGADAGFQAVSGEVTVDTTSSESPPASARVRAEGTTSYLESTLVGAAFALAQQVSFDIKIDLGPTSTVTFWQAAEVGSGCTFALGSRGTAAALYATAPDADGGRLETTSVLAAGPVTGAWSHVVVRLERKSGGVSVVVKVGSVTALEQQTFCKTLSTTLTTRFGLTSELKENAIAHYDNILIEEN